MKEQIIVDEYICPTCEGGKFAIAPDVVCPECNDTGKCTFKPSLVKSLIAKIHSLEDRNANLIVELAGEQLKSHAIFEQYERLKRLDENRKAKIKQLQHPANWSINPSPLAIIMMLDELDK